MKYGTLTPIEGGVCAPSGFTARSLRFVGEDIRAVWVSSQKRCAAACVAAEKRTIGDRAAFSIERAKTGYASAFFCDDGTNALLAENKRDCLSLCNALAKRMGADGEEILLASNGALGRSVFALTQAVQSASVEEGLSNAWATRSYAFDLDNYTCTIGAAYTVEPQNGGMLCCITTDADIAPQMLQKALTSAVNEGFRMLCVNGCASPNDFTCAFANGKAGNYKISRADSEYKKFSRALCETVSSICRAIVERSDGIPFVCTVRGAASKRTAYEIAKRAAGSADVKNALCKDTVASTLYALLCDELTAESVRRAEISLRLDEENAALLLAEEGIALPSSQNTRERIAKAYAIELVVALRDGNYGATGYGRI